MSQLLNRFELAKELQTIIQETEFLLILISPYFKLNDQLRKDLSALKNKEDFELFVVYGKNEEDKRKSLSDEDMAFFKSFNNVEIRYHKRLHAKIYANEQKCLITSLNLHDYSLRENIEVGVLTKSKGLALGLLSGLANLVVKDTIPDSLDEQAIKFAEYIVEKSTLEFEKKQKIKKSFFGLFETKTGDAEVILEKSRTGFCIRTKQVIPINIKLPYSPNAYNSWLKFKNAEYQERYCHGCGKEHPVTMQKPFCIDCFKKYIK
jgi:hypothetical protein